MLKKLMIDEKVQYVKKSYIKHVEDTIMVKNLVVSYT